MFRSSIRAVSSKRFFTVSTRRSNLISELYVSQIKQFKPTPVSAEQTQEAVKAFQLPTKPSVPSEEISADGLAAYESAEVETASAAPSEGAAPAAEEDWFVFEEPEEKHH